MSRTCQYSNCRYRCKSAMDRIPIPPDIIPPSHAAHISYGEIALASKICRDAHPSKFLRLGRYPSQNVPISSPSGPNRETQPPMDIRYAPLAISFKLRSVYLSDERQKAEILHPTQINPPPLHSSLFTLHPNHRLRTHLQVENHHITR
jgi:hypothetical protein